MLEVQLRQKAVQLTREMAEQYTSATGLHVSTAKTIADVGLLGNGRTDDIDGSFAARRGSAQAKFGATDNYNFAPEDALISASIEAEFLAE